jgi:hypothetical protein
LGTRDIGGDADRRNGIALVGNHAIEPTVDLIPKQPEAASEFGSNGALGHNAATFAVPVLDGRHLDDETPSGDPHNQRRVIQVALPPTLQEGAHRLERPAAELDDLLT